MPVFYYLILAAVVTTLLLMILYGGRTRAFNRRRSNIPASLSLFTEPNRAPLPHELKHKYVSIAKTTLEIRNGKTWVKHREEVPLLHPSYNSDPQDLRQYRIIFN